MNRFKNILVLYAQRIGDEAALDRATELAKRNKARLTVVEVVERVPADPAVVMGTAAVEQRELESRFVAERQAHLDRLIGSVRQDGVEVTAAVLRGTPFLEIIRSGEARAFQEASFGKILIFPVSVLEQAH